MENVIEGKKLETKDNKVVSVSKNSTDVQYPSAKCTYKIKEDVVTLLTDIKEENFKNVSELEIIDVERMLPMLIECYKEQAEQVLNNSNKLLVKNNR